MKKSNWLLLGLAAVAAAFLLYLWVYLGFYKIDNPLDAILGIGWWVIIALLGYLIAKNEKERQRRVRTIYVEEGKLFNSETGEVELEQGTTVAEAAGKLLAGLKYGFERKELPEGAKVAFVIESDEYKDSDEPTWKGKVTKVVPDGENVVTEFDGTDQLVAALAA